MKIEIKELKVCENGEVKTFHVLVAECFVADTVEKLEARVGALVKANDQLSIAKEQAQERIDQLEKTLRSEREALHKTIQDLQTRKLADCETREFQILTERKADIARLEKALDNRRHELGAKESRIKVLEEDNKRWEEIAANIRCECAKLKAVVAMQDQRIKDLTFVRHQ